VALREESIAQLAVHGADGVSVEAREPPPQHPHHLVPVAVQRAHRHAVVGGGAGVPVEVQVPELGQGSHRRQDRGEVRQTVAEEAARRELGEALGQPVEAPVPKAEATAHEREGTARRRERERSMLARLRQGQKAPLMVEQRVGRKGQRTHARIGNHAAGNMVDSAHRLEERKSLARFGATRPSRLVSRLKLRLSSSRAPRDPTDSREATLLWLRDRDMRLDNPKAHE
jgi:hypothetical protein